MHAVHVSQWLFDILARLSTSTAGLNVGKSMQLTQTAVILGSVNSTSSMLVKGYTTSLPVRLCMW